jgi:Cu(I)/Ag(I) efflux system membrane fusion protein
VQAILPDVEAVTRTIKARVELANPARLLAPGMFVTVVLAGPSTDALMVPTEAVIETGTRSVVMRAQPNGTFQPVDVTVGIESEGQTEIKSGLTAGQMVVVSGQFLLDSEASLRATSTRMEGATAPQTSTTHSGEGKIEALDADSVTLSHGPIASIQWGAMTMRFMLPADKPAENFAVGQSVRFSFVMDDDGKPRIVEIAPSGGGR